jgi:hypothetical protein
MNRRPKLILAAVGLLVAIAASTFAEEPKPIATFRAFAVSMMGGGAGVMQVNIYRWSTDAERTSLIAKLATKGPDATLQALMALPQVGFIKTPNSMGYALFYAYSTPLPDGGHKVVLATDRALSFGQMVRQPTSNDWDYSVVQMQFPKSGKGKGTLVLAAKVSIDPKTQKFEVNNYQGEPVLLRDIEEKQGN